MSNANNNKGSIDTHRAGGRPKLARYERRNHHHKVSYNDEEENIIQYKAEQVGKPDDVYLHEAGLDAVVQAHMSDENIEQLRDVCGMQTIPTRLRIKPMLEGSFPYASRLSSLSSL